MHRPEDFQGEETLPGGEIRESAEIRPRAGESLKEEIISGLEGGVALLDRTVENIGSKAKAVAHWENLDEEQRGRLKDTMITIGNVLLAAGLLEAFDSQIVQNAFEMDASGGGALLSIGELAIALSRGAKGLIHGYMAIKGRPEASAGLTEEDMDHLSLIDLAPRDKEGAGK